MAVGPPAFGRACAARPSNEAEEDEARSGSERPGVASNGSQPYPGNHASTHACASRSVTWKTPSRRSPGANPSATRAGTPERRASAASDAANIWQWPASPDTTQRASASGVLGRPACSSYARVVRSHASSATTAWYGVAAPRVAVRACA